MPASLERFGKTTRWFHWTFVSSFLVLAGTGAALALRGWLGLGARPTATVVRVHEIAAVALLVLPTLVLLSGDTRATLADFRELLRWSRRDLRWLALQPLAALGRAELPAAGKLNAGQKLNGLATAAATAGLVATGLWLWARPGSLVAWFVHMTLFAAWIPLFLGHFSLATIVPGTRPALRGMVTGRVDRAWAAHHHALWVRELERDSAPEPAAPTPPAAGAGERPAPALRGGSPLARAAGAGADGRS